MKEELDKCILCGNLTPYINNVHISKRKYYIECAGQLCEQCYKNLYEVNIAEEIKEI